MSEANPTPETKEIRHVLTPTQYAAVQELIEQRKAITERINDKLVFFLNYVIRDAKLPTVTNGYQLSPDGKALIGHLPVEHVPANNDTNET